jgi:hypothetical protein
MKIKASSSSIYQNGLKSLFSNQPLVSKLINSQQNNQSTSVSSSQYNRNPDLNGHYHYVNHQLTRSMRNSSNSVDYLSEQQQQQQQQLPTSSNLSSISNTSSFISTPSIFTQSDELNHHNPNNVNQHQITEVIKCTYTNEINKDELPRPNFVSSVKNLFEKQIHTVNGEANKLTENINITNNANSLKSHHNLHHLHSSSNAVSMNSSSSSLTKSNLLNRPNGGHIEPTPPPTSILESNLNIPVSPSSSSSLSGSSTTSSPSSATSTANSSASSSPPSYLKAENLVDILKQNGTLVYEHSQAEFSANINATIEQHRKIN